METELHLFSHFLPYSRPAGW